MDTFGTQIQEELPLQKNNEMRSFDFSSRLRFRLTYQKSLSKQDSKTKWNLVVYDEIFSILNRREYHLSLIKIGLF